MRLTDVLRLAAVGGLLAFAVYGQARGQDGDSFASELTAARIKAGLGAVVRSDNAMVVAAANNASQRAKGLGHYITGGLAQCSAIGCSTPGQALAMWANSPPHAAILFHPGLTAVGFACDGYCATVACQIGPQNQAAPVMAGTGRVSHAGAAFHPRRRLFSRCR